MRARGRFSVVTVSPSKRGQEAKEAEGSPRVSWPKNRGEDGWVGGWVGG